MVRGDSRRDQPGPCVGVTGRVDLSLSLALPMTRTCCNDSVAVCSSHDGERLTLSIGSREVLWLRASDGALSKEQSEWCNGPR